MAGIIGLATISPLNAGHAAETQTSFDVSVIVANTCSVRLTARPGVNSHCAWPQPATVSAVPEALTPTASRGESQGVRYLAIEY
jgi:hypothetical protein